MVKPRNHTRLMKSTWSSMMVLYHNRFWWGVIKSFSIFTLSIPLIRCFVGFELMPGGN